MRSRSPGGIFIIAVLLWFVTLGHAGAQTDAYTFVFLGIHDGEGVLSPAESRVLENRLASFLIQIEQLESYDFLFPEDASQIRQGIITPTRREISSQAIPEVWNPLARGIIIGEINRISGVFYLDLQIFSRSTGRLLLSQQSEFASFQAMVSELRGTTFRLFGIEDTPSQGLTQGLAQQGNTPLFQESPTVAMIQGRWIGDTGIGTVTVNRDGTAVAGLGDDEQMQLQVRIEGGVIRVRQNEPNSPKMYMTLFPYSIATQIVQLARPMSWEFQLSMDGKRLVGNKFTSYVTVDQGVVTRVDNTYFREAVWTRPETGE
ncbi:TP0183 family DNA metabolism protein [Spirochaeta lutea]|uniref:Uncharacterized protein n=1 Tax=Spirochaeta lutea TaxID=1480694 RepID=A0A098QU65_9SPIO|nr:hypothetical protein [Spirochaeta lutea]KGE71365.1 hypothetical protein DC28_11185 [Spirochaeta lutea]